MKRYIVFIIICISLLISARQRVGLALGGGSARGLAHIGVLKALEENNIPIDCIGGTSIGAIVGGFYAAGYSAARIESIFVHNDVRSWFFADSKNSDLPVYMLLGKQDLLLKIDYQAGKFNLPQATLDDKMINFEIERYFSPVDYSINGDFRNLPIPFLCTAADIYNNELIIFTSGKLTKAIRSSMSLPVIFKPVKDSSRLFMDGGIYNNLPVKALKDSLQADYIISVDVSSRSKHTDLENISLLDIGFSLMDFITADIDPDTMSKYGCYIRPDISDYRGFEFEKAEEFIKIGYDAAMKNMAKIKKDLVKSGYDLRDNGGIQETNTPRIIDYNGMTIDTLIIDTDNRLYQILTRNIIKMSRNDKFYFTEFEEKVIQLKAMALFDELSFEFFPDTVSGSISVKINEASKSNMRLGLGGLYSNNAGANIYGEIFLSNLFSRAVSMNIYPYLGEYLKGLDVNIYSPPLLFSRFASYIKLNYLVKKYYAVWENTYGYYGESNIICAMGNNYERQSFIGLFSGYKYSDYPYREMEKVSSGFIFKTDYLARSHDNSGYEFKAIMSLNIPRIQSQEDFSGFHANNLFMKAYFRYENFIRFSRQMGAGLTAEFGLINFLQQYVEKPSEMQADYFRIVPLTSFYYKYDDYLLSDYTVGISLYSRYNISDIIYIHTSAMSYLSQNKFHSGSPGIIYGSELYTGAEGVLGDIKIGLEYINTDVNDPRLSFNVFWGTYNPALTDIFHKL
ncbi:MAG: patatin-like phospholipase family protein [bacterium]